MSLSDTAEYWNDVKGHYRGWFGVTGFWHAKGCQCGHFHKNETRYISEVDCKACLKVLAEMGNIFNLKEKREIRRGKNLVNLKRKKL